MTEGVYSGWLNWSLKFVTLTQPFYKSVVVIPDAHLLFVPIVIS